MRRGFRIGVLTVLAAVSVCAGAAGVSVHQASGRVAARPNVVVIMTDDQTVENVRVMTNVRRLLMRHGTTFTNSFVSFPLCCPSRATFLTGRYSHNTGVIGNHYDTGLSRFDQRRTLAVWLRRSGYATIFVGKYLNDYRRAPVEPPGWSDWNGGLNVNYFRHSVLENGRVRYYGTKPQDYSTTVYGGLAVEALRRYAPSPRPFFLWLAFKAPHDGDPHEAGDPPGLGTPNPAPRDRGRLAGVPLPRWPSLNEADVKDKPLAIRRRPLLTPTQLEELRTKYEQRLESLLSVDRWVGRIVDELRRLHELKRTLIVFTSDNGFLEGQHRVLSGKEQVYEPSIRVPLVLRGPRVPAGARRSQLVSNVDLAPTILAYARTRSPLPMDGRSLLPLLRDRTLEWGRDLLFERYPDRKFERPRSYTALRTPRYKFVQYATGERELYDLAKDHDELRNLSGQPALAVVESELAARLLALEDCEGNGCRVGPALDLELTPADACATPPLTVRLAGTDEPHVSYVDFTVDGRRSRDARTPFERVVESPRPGLVVRALAALDDGRRVTIARTVRC